MSEPKKNYRTLLKNKDYRKSLAAVLFNRFGDSLDVVALSWLVYQISGMASFSALNAAVNYIPTVFLQPFCGTLVERRNHKWIIALCDIGRAMIPAVIVSLFFAGVLRPWMIITGTFFISTLEAFRQPAHMALIPEILDTDEFAAGVSLNQSMTQTAVLVGMGMSGVLIAAGGIGFAVIIDAACFFASGLLIALIHAHKRTEHEGQEDFLSALKSGCRYLFADPVLRTVAFIAVTVNVLFLPLSSMQAAMCQEILHSGAEVISIIGISITVGAAAGGLIYPKIREKVRCSFLTGLILSCGGLVYAAFLLAGRYHDNPFVFYPVIIGVPCVMGLMTSMINITIEVFVLEKTEKGYLSRVSSLLGSLCTAAQPVVAFLMSAILLKITLADYFRIMIIVSIAVAVIALRLPALRRMDEMSLVREAEAQ